MRKWETPCWAGQGIPPVRENVLGGCGRGGESIFSPLSTLMWVLEIKLSKQAPSPVSSHFIRGQWGQGWVGGWVGEGCDEKQKTMWTFLL